MKTTHAENIDAYIAGFPEDIQKRLESMRATIRKAAPEAEKILNMPYQLSPSTVI